MSESKAVIADYKQRVEKNVEEILQKYGENFKDIPEDAEWIIGIDEAGRGPVLGPMVYGAAFYPKSVEKYFRGKGSMKFDDSKKLTETVRHILFHDVMEKIDKRICGHFVDVIDPNDMCNKAFAKFPQNLNVQSHQSALGLIQKILETYPQLNFTEFYLDTVGPKLKYQTWLQNQFGRNDCKYKIVVEEKADSKFPVVSAASICAKVTRDECVKNWKFQEKPAPTNRKFGSGYPGDPKTKAWLQANIDNVFGFPDIVRYTWQTTKKIMNEKCKGFIFDEDNGQQKLDFTMNNTNYGKKKQEGFFFTKLKMNSKIDF